MNSKVKTRATRQKYSDGSTCEIDVTLSKTILRRITISLGGPIAAIPSLKNSKMPGRNFLSPLTMIRLQIMDALYWQALKNANFGGDLTFGKQAVGVLCVCARRKVAFDSDNVFATVRDWLEPRTKTVGRNKARGWGIGIVENDRQVRGFAIYDSDIGLMLNKTIIVIQPYELMRDNLRSFIHDIFLSASNDKGLWAVN